MGQNLDLSFQPVNGPIGISVLPIPAFRLGQNWRAPSCLSFVPSLGDLQKNSLVTWFNHWSNFLHVHACVYIYIMLLYLYMSVCMCVSIGEFIHVSRSQTYCGHDPSSLYPGKRVPLGHQRLRMARNDLTRTPTWLCSLGWPGFMGDISEWCL